MSFADPDLTALRDSGAKMLVWHGLADELIAPGGSTDYHRRVVDAMAGAEPGTGTVDDFYRLFLAPGVEHCGGGAGLDPTAEVFLELMAWVENGTAPARLAASGPAVGRGAAGDDGTASRTIGLCLYPGVLTFTGADPNDEASFECL